MGHIGNKNAVGNSGRWKKFDSPESMQKEIDRYFNECDNGMKNGEPFPIPYTIAGLCDTLGITRQTFLNYEKEDSYIEFFDVIKKARNRVLRDMEERGLNGESSTAFSIFLLKNHYGYSDKTEQEVVSTSSTTIIFEGEPGERIKFANNEDEINVDRESRAYKKE